jgi:hypothetical protein
MVPATDDVTVVAWQLALDSWRNGHTRLLLPKIEGIVISLH